MKKNYLDIISKIDTFVFDMDGVLTDGSVTIMPNGEQVRKMNIKDGYALQLAVKKGYKIAVISGGKSEIITSRFNGLGIYDVYMNTANKVHKMEEYCLTHSIDLQTILYMGDDIPDYEVMTTVAMACCPANAAKEIQNIAHYISPINGGEGCVRDIIEKVMTVRGDWFESLEKDKNTQFIW